MFSILDGRDSFFQWDLAQKVVIDEECTNVHFVINGKIEATAVKKENEKFVAEVPNKLLQYAGKLVVFAFVALENGGFTKEERCFAVKARPKPPEYVYTETDVIEWESLRGDVEAIKEKLTKFLNSEDESFDELNEIVVFIKENRELIKAAQFNYEELDKTVNLLEKRLNDFFDTENETVNKLSKIDFLIEENKTAVKNVQNEIEALKEELGEFFDIDDETLDELSEIIAFIKNNKELIENATTAYDIKFGEVDHKIAKLEADLNYTPIKILSFKKSGTTVFELGAAVKDVTLEWELNKVPVRVMLDNKVLVPQQFGNYIINFGPLEEGYTKSQSWGLIVTDERSATDSETASISFYNGIYYGDAELPEKIDGAFLRTLKNKVLSNQKNRTVEYASETSANHHFFYAYPKRLGTSVFNIGGFEYEYNLSEISFENNYGYTEDYYVYVSGKPMYGKVNITVKEG